jgi:hypothetical protein
MDSDSVSGSTGFTILIANYQEVTKAFHSFILKGGMKVGEVFNGRVIPVPHPLKAIPYQHPMRILEVPLIQLAAESFKKNMGLILG